MSSKTEKLAVAATALILIVAAVVVMSVGSFLPHWCAVRNSSAHGNVSFSLWTRRQCFGLICHTEHVTVQWTNEDCWRDRDTGQERCETTTGTKLRSKTKCRVANFCNTTWVAGADLENTPSMLIVAKAFETPAIFFAIVCIVLYVIKIVLLVRRPGKRLHLKAAYLTFGAIAGVVAILGVILFCAMLEGDMYSRQWAPYLNLSGGIVYLLFGLGGYLRWRDRTADGDFEDDTSLCERNMHEIHPPGGASVLRQTSQTSAKAAEAFV
ncbi:uncharacterized protein LOC143275624 [Babylonia areolata]|uniref:uncharacterized protein LOC143275624 n=1 Tax=Babylonia areolata TaxID=304850 RepID=UPI003FD35C37